MLDFPRKFLILGEGHSKFYLYSSHEVAHVTVLVSWDFNSVVDSIKIPAQDFIVVVPYSITILHFFVQWYQSQCGLSPREVEKLHEFHVAWRVIGS